MVVDRRGFLKMAGIAGLVGVGIAIKPLYDVFTRVQLPKTSKSGVQAGVKWAMVIDPKACSHLCVFVLRHSADFDFHRHCKVFLVYIRLSVFHHRDTEHTEKKIIVQRPLAAQNRLCVLYDSVVNS